MQNVQIACPALNTYSAILDIRSLDPSALLIKLSKELGPSDIVTVYGTQDSAATSSSTNLTLLGTLPGNNGNSSNGLSISGWAFLFFFRAAGVSSGGYAIASGNQNGTGASVAPPSVALPALNAFSAPLSLSALAGSSFLVGLSANQTSRDTFIVYGTNDATAGTPNGVSGGQLLGTIQGGDGTAPGNVLNVGSFSYVFFQRTGGSTSGNAFAWGTSVTASGGGSGSVTAVTATSPIVSSGGTTPNLSAPTVLKQGGNAFGAAYVAGSTDAEPTQIVSEGVPGLIVDSTAPSVTLGFLAGTNTSSSTTVRSGTGGLSLIGFAVNVQSSTTAAINGQSITIDTVGNGGSVNIGASASQKTINLGTSSATTQVNVGSATTGSQTTIQGTGIGVGVAAPTSGTVIDAPSGSYVTIAGTNASGAVIGNNNTGSSTANGFLSGTGGTTIATLGSLVLQAGALILMNGPTAKTTVAVGNLPTGGVIGTAANTVNVADWFIVNQTTPGQTLSLPNPTTGTGRRVTIQNTGTASFSIYGATVAASATNSQSVIDLAWDSTNNRWVLFAT